MSKNDWLNHVVEIYFGYVLEEYKICSSDIRRES